MPLVILHLTHVQDCDFQIQQMLTFLAKITSDKQNLTIKIKRLGLRKAQ